MVRLPRLQPPALLAPELLAGPLAPAPAAADALPQHAAAVAALPSFDQEFLRRLNESILRHLADEEFGVDQLGADIGMGRTQVHRKLKALTGQSPGEAIRSMRLLRAQVGTVAEVGSGLSGGVWQPGGVLYGVLAAV